MGVAGGPNLVEDGIVLALDASDRNSYVSGSSTSYSLIGTFSGSFTNGASYASNNQGVFTFDGTNDYIAISNAQQLNPGTGSFTVDFWCNVSSSVGTGSASCALEARGSNLNGFLCIAYTTNGRMQFFVNGNQDGGQNVYQSTTTPVQRDVWVHEAMVMDRSTQQITFYYNGSQTGNKVTITDTGSIDPGTGYVYWVGGDKGGAPMEGQIANLRQYSKALSADEVLQNYNATKTRFGL